MTNLARVSLHALPLCTRIHCAQNAIKQRNVCAPRIFSLRIPPRWEIQRRFKVAAKRSHDFCVSETERLSNVCHFRSAFGKLREEQSRIQEFLISFTFAYIPSKDSASVSRKEARSIKRARGYLQIGHGEQHVSSFDRYRAGSRVRDLEKVAESPRKCVKHSRAVAIWM